MQDLRQRHLELNTITCSVAIGACEKGKHPEKLLEIIGEMQQKGLELDVTMYSVAINASEKGEHPEKALELLREMQQRGVERIVITYNAITIVFTCNIILWSTYYSHSVFMQ